MIMLNESYKNKVLNFITNNFCLFKDFNSVYLFGSALNTKSEQHDIDLLLIYVEYSEEIILSLKLIRDILEKEFSIFIDLTVLSEAELEETGFLKKIVRFYKIK